MPDHTTSSSSRTEPSSAHKEPATNASDSPASVASSTVSSGFTDDENPFGAITVMGARENNLRNIDVKIPKRKLTVITGVSGSGKSSLVFDTIAAESQRLINETYPAFAQGFMPSLPRPDVDVLKASRLPSLLAKNRWAPIHAPPWEQLPMWTPVCASCFPALASHISVPHRHSRLMCPPYPALGP